MTAIRARWAVAAVFLVNGGLLGSWAPHVPLVKERLALSDLDLGFALLVMAIGAVTTMPFTGLIVARTGSAPLTKAAIVAMALALPFVTLAPNWPALLVAAYLFGAGMGLSDVAMNTHAVEVERRMERPIMSSLHGMFSVGGFAASALGGLALAVATPAVHAVATTIVALAILAVMLRGMLPGDADRSEPGAAFALPSRAVAVIGLLTFTVFMTEGAMLDWTAVYLRDELLASPSLAAAGYAAFAGGMALGRFSGDAIRRTFSAVALVTAGALMAAAAIGAGVVSGMALVTIVGLGIAGLGLSNVVPVLFVAAGKAPGQPAATGVAAVATTGYFGLLAGPPVIGFVAEHWSLALAFGLLAAACLGVALAGGSARPADSP
jgi:predicted MFS family arabinose efflux permease